MEARVKLLLHAGCGTATKPDEYAGYHETRVDADPSVCPHVVASVAAMPSLKDDWFDAVYCNHCLEHLPQHEAAMALAEFRRVLVPGGFLDLRVPDLQAVAGRVACDEPEALLYQSPIGPITPLDVLYGHRASVAYGRPFMQHRTGFTASSLQAALARAGFPRVEVKRSALFELRAIAFKESADASQERGAEAPAECEVRTRLGEKTSF